MSVLILSLKDHVLSSIYTRTLGRVTHFLLLSLLFKSSREWVTKFSKPSFLLIYRENYNCLLLCRICSEKMNIIVLFHLISFHFYSQNIRSVDPWIATGSCAKLEIKDCSRQDMNSYRETMGLSVVWPVSSGYENILYHRRNWSKRKHRK